MEERTAGRPVLTVVVPAYQEEETVPLAAAEIPRALEGIPFELLFVDDGSRDGTWAAVQAAGRADPRIRGIRFSRNFGKESAIFAGLASAAGDCVAVCDCDLQHPPEKLREMLDLWRQGWQVVEGVKADRGEEGALHRMAAKGFYSIISRAAGIDMSRASDFKLLDRRAVDVLVAMREKDAFFRALSSWIGFRTTQVEYEVRPRAAGTTKWSLGSLVRYAVTDITAFTAAPLQIVTAMGVVTLLFSVGLGAQSLWMKISGQAMEGFTTVILLQLLIGSALMISLGIIGYYLAKIYEEIKDRPRYIIAERSGGGSDGT